MTKDEKTGGETGNQRILVIDDSPVIRDMLEEVLTDEGFTVDTATDGQEGIKLISDRDYLAVICDIHMPRMNGLETVREILSIRPGTGIIMTDSYPDKLAKQARDEGALCCLQKPFDLEELREMLISIKTGRAVKVER